MKNFLAIAAVLIAAVALMMPAELLAGGGFGSRFRSKTVTRFRAPAPAPVVQFNACPPQNFSGYGAQQFQFKSRQNFGGGCGVQNFSGYGVQQFRAAPQQFNGYEFQFRSGY